MPNKIYIHDGLKNNEGIIECLNINDWKSAGIPYIAIYKKNIDFNI